MERIWYLIPMREPPPIESPIAILRLSLSLRLALLSALLCAEKIALTTLVDGRRARQASGLGGFLHLAQHWGFRYLVTFIAVLSLFAFVKTGNPAKPREVAAPLPRISLRWMLIHGLFVANLAPLSYFLYRGDITAAGLMSTAGLWLITCSIAIVAASVGIIPSATWLRLFRSIGVGWIYAAAVALLAMGTWAASEKLWDVSTAITFELVTLVLMPILPLSYADPTTHVIATPRFAVEITEVCSGLEGLGLTLAFSVAWLIYFRREYIFPRALLVIPLALAAIFGLNVLRIAALMLIGNAGYPEVASFGFHSQAGWIAFNGVACAVVYFSRRSPWLNRTTANSGEHAEIYNPTATYLVPLLAILAAGTLSHAISGRFEAFYPLRLIAAVAALLVFRKPLLAMPWRFTWRGPAVGIGMYLLWIGCAHWLMPESSEPGSLAAMQTFARAIWITGHFLTSAIFVPIAEELAYRGYLMRRLIHPDFESVRYGSVRWAALTVTAIAFGAAHGALWAPGIAAGLVYGLLVIRRDSLAEAIVAHGTTNALIAFSVIAANQWQFW